MALTKAIELLKVLKQEVSKYHSGYDQLIASFLEDKQRKKPIEEFLQDLRAITLREEAVAIVKEPNIQHPGM